MSLYGVASISGQMEPEETNLLHLSFPIDMMDGDSESLVRVFAQFASSFDLDYGFAGYSLRRTEGTMQLATAALNALLPYCHSRESRDRG